MSAIDLREHMESYGIRHFASSAYWAWGAETLGFHVAKELEKLRKPLERGDATPKQLDRFYNFIAQGKVAADIAGDRACFHRSGEGAGVAAVTSRLVQRA